MSRCKNCGASIEWLRSDSGQMIPIDPEPVFVVIDAGKDRFYTDEGNVIYGRQLLSDESESECEVAFVPHWRTCPNPN